MGVDAHEPTHFKIAVIIYTSASDDDQKGEEQERRLARRKNTKYFKTLRQCFFGEYYLKLKFPRSQGAGELFNQYYQRLLTIDKKALKQRGQELTDDIKETSMQWSKSSRAGTSISKTCLTSLGIATSQGFIL